MQIKHNFQAYFISHKRSHNQLDIFPLLLLYYVVESYIPILTKQMFNVNVIIPRKLKKYSNKKYFKTQASEYANWTCMMG